MNIQQVCQDNMLLLGLKDQIERKDVNNVLFKSCSTQLSEYQKSVNNHSITQTIKSKIANQSRSDISFWEKMQRNQFKLSLIDFEVQDYQLKYGKSQIDLATINNQVQQKQAQEAVVFIIQLQNKLQKALDRIGNINNVQQLIRKLNSKKENNSPHFNQELSLLRFMETFRKVQLFIMVEKTNSQTTDNQQQWFQNIQKSLEALKKMKLINQIYRINQIEILIQMKSNVLFSYFESMVDQVEMQKMRKNMFQTEEEYENNFLIHGGAFRLTCHSSNSDRGLTSQKSVKTSCESGNKKDREDVERIGKKACLCSIW